MSIFYLQEDYKKRIHEKIREKEIYLGQGKAESIERYREVAGRISGLKEALEIFNDVAKNHGDIEDEHE